MKRQLILPILVMVVLIGVSFFTAPKEPEELPSPSVSESAVSPAQPPFGGVTPPSASPISPPVSTQRPPAIPEAERIYPSKPSLVKLEPYLDGSYTDGVNTFIFEDDGTVLWNDSRGRVNGDIHTFEKKDIVKPLDKKALMETEEYKAAYERAAEWLQNKYSGQLFIAHRDGDTWYLYYDYPTGGGSGEAYWIDDETIFVKISAEGEISDWGALKAAHIVWYKDWFYYVELESGILFTPGLGQVKRVDMNGQNRETVVDEPVYGTIQVINDRVYYTSLADGRAYSVGLDGKDKTQISEKIVPQYHRVGLEFYEDVIISRHWNNFGYSYGISVLPTDYSMPAIMDINERKLITFPPELCGDDAYEVINWGGEESYYEEYGSGRNVVNFLFLKSNYDGSYWVYEKYGVHSDLPELFEAARAQWNEKAG